MNETFFWHPFAQMGQVKDHQLVIARGEDVWVWDCLLYTSPSPRDS